MEWLSLLGIRAFVDRWRSHAMEAAIAAEDRSTLFRIELREYKRGVVTAALLALGLAALTVVALTVLSAAILMEFWETPNRMVAAWTVSGVWIVLWAIAAFGLWSLIKKAGDGFQSTRQELAQDWREIKEQL